MPANDLEKLESLPGGSSWRWQSIVGRKALFSRFEWMKKGHVLRVSSHVLCWAFVRWNEGNGVVVLSPPIVSDVSRMHLVLVSGLRKDAGPSNALIYTELM